MTTESDDMYLKELNKVFAETEQLMLEHRHQLVLDTYKVGYSFVASWFNRAFDRYPSISIRIPLLSKDTSVSFYVCRRELSNLLMGIRGKVINLPLDEKLFPWCVGYLGSQDGEPSNEPCGIRLKGLEGDSWTTEEDIVNCVAVKYGYGWNTDEPWKKYVIEPMEWQASEWLKWLDKHFDT